VKSPEAVGHKREISNAGKYVKTGFFRKKSMQTGSSETLIGWKSGKKTYVSLWARMEGACLWIL
jgi:hypothetical protein